MISFCSFEEVRSFESNSVSFFQVVFCSQPTVALRHWKQYRTRTFKPYTSLNYWFQYCVQYCDLHWALVKCQRPSEECTKNLGDTFDCRHAYIRQKFSLFYYFSCLIGNPNNFEINRLTRLVVNGMFPLPYTTSLMRFSSF